VECIGKGKAHRPYEFGVKVFRRHHVGARQGQSVRHHVKALPGNPYEGHALKTIILDSNVWRRAGGQRRPSVLN
jgi:transposase, IS5 family